jgi:large subunit ribosomal protein L24
MGIRIRKGDTVQVIAGEHKGTVARVLSVDAEKQRVIVEKVNLVKRHTKPRGTMANQQSGIVEKEAPIHLSNVQLYDPKAQRGTRLGVRIGKDGRRERISRRTGEAIAKAD